MDARIVGNVQKMVNQNAPQEDIDGYLRTEGMTPDQFREGLSSANVQAKPLDDGILANLNGAVSEPILKLATSTIAKPAGDIAGLGAILARLTGMSDTADPAQIKQRVQSAMTYEPSTVLGASKYNPLNAIPDALGQGVGYIANPAADAVGGGAPVDSFRGAARDAVREAIPQAIGIGVAKLADVLPESLASKQAKLDVLKGQNQATDAVIQAGRDAGYKFTPDELSKFGVGHPVGSALEDVAGLHVYHLGKEANAMDTLASRKNYATTVNLIRDDLKLPDGSPVPKSMTMSNESLDSFIKKHGGSYEAVSSLKEPMTYTPAYQKAVEGLDSEMSAAKAQYPELMKTDGLDTLKSSLLNGTSTSAEAAMQLIRKLRDDASRVMSSADPTPEAFALAKLKKKAANTVEDMIGENLTDLKKTALFNAFQKSRTQIAKAYEVKDAMGEGSVVNPAKLARNGEGLTGNLKIIQDMALQHPNLMLDPRGLSTKGSGVAANAAVGLGVAAFGHPVLGAAIAARPLLGKAMLSNPYQTLFSKVPTYQAMPGSIGPMGTLFGASIPSQVEQDNQQ